MNADICNFFSDTCVDDAKPTQTCWLKTKQSGWIMFSFLKCRTTSRAERKLGHSRNVYHVSGTQTMSAHWLLHNHNSTAPDTPIDWCKISFAQLLILEHWKLRIVMMPTLSSQELSWCWHHGPCRFLDICWWKITMFNISNTRPKSVLSSVKAHKFLQCLMMPTLTSLAALEVVATTTSSAASNDKVGIMSILKFQCKSVIEAVEQSMLSGRPPVSKHRWLKDVGGGPWNGESQA